jgi:hypothetical protein
MHKITIPNLRPSESDYVFHGSQKNCDGEGSLNEINRTIVLYQDYFEQNIRFNTMCVAPSLQGGSCSAMTVTFLSKVMQIIQKMNNFKQDGIQRNQLINLAENFLTSGETFISQQLVLNTIQVLSKEKLDFLPGKVQGILHLKNLAMKQVVFIDDLDDYQNEKCKTSFCTALQKANLGLYIIRSIKTAYENNKKEDFGHSMALIKGPDTSYFYDPNSGLVELKENTFSKLFNYISLLNKQNGTCRTLIGELILKKHSATQGASSHKR